MTTRLSRNVVNVLSAFFCMLITTALFLVFNAPPSFKSRWPVLSSFVITPHRSCSSLPSLNTDFHLELCHDPTFCNSFSVNIRRVNASACQLAEGVAEPSTDPNLNTFMRNERGPDAFLIRTDGAERFASVWSKYNGSCAYTFDVDLRNAGDVYLQVWRTFQAYQAFSETNTSWPEMLLEPLAHPISLHICPSTYKTLETPRLQRNTSQLTYPPIIDTPASPARGDFLPECFGKDPIRGRYLPIHPLDRIYPLVQFPEPRRRPMMGRYQFVPDACRWTHAGLPFGDPGPCVSHRKKILVVGDSHGRVAYDVMVHRLSGKTDVLQESKKAGSKSVTIGQTTLEFLWGAIMRTKNCTVFDSVDALAISMGAHFATRSSTDEYTSALRDILSNVNACSNSPSIKIFMTSPAQPPRQGKYVRENNDHRTNVRLQHWRDLSLQLTRSHGWSTIDMFELTMPHHMEPMYSDMAHYLMTDAMDPIVDEMIGKTEVCA